MLTPLATHPSGRVPASSRLDAVGGVELGFVEVEGGERRCGADVVVDVNSAIGDVHCVSSFGWGGALGRGST